ncbi:MAG: FAD-dependent oxidoreductase [candidate division Zixibacteria bacterium]|jgi:NADPH-dependent glutamate synthase beta subunit-like oxidoreductase|nr:FAD-dependent oxidoreductase [candidate division Zixibacteria bacterium]
MLLPVLVLTGIGVVAAVGLGIAARVFYVKEDPRIKGVLDILPGANCGGCGFAGCSACAEAIVRGEAEANACVVGQTEVAQEVALYLGMAPVGSEPRIACPDCQGGIRATRKYEYAGFDDCRAAVLYFQGHLICYHGCLGLGTCVKSCQFGAITMGEHGLPKFNPDLCVGCGACARNCPKGIISLISEKTKILHWNQYTECLAPCRQKCPAQINIPKYIQHIKRGEYEQALLTIKERNPMPLSIGRVCPEPCALACRRTINDEPVAINYLKRFVADWEMNSGKRLHIPVGPSTGKRVAVVGGGPGGLSAAFYLRRLGHDVTIYDKMPALGGMLRYGIPEYRLPKKVLDWEIEGILNLGITATTGVEFGKDFNMEFLRAKGFDAIFIAVGAWREQELKMEGTDLHGVYSGIAFLEQLHSGRDVSVGRHVVVIGGGNTAIDAARSSLRMQAETVTIVYRRSRDEMPANPAEIVAAEEENVKFRFLSAPLEIIGEGGHVTGLKIQGMKLGDPDPSGRRRPVAIEGSEEMIECDTIIQAVGQSPNLDFLSFDGQPNLQVTRRNTIDASEDTLQTDLPYVFTGGDCFTGPALVVDAIAAGRFAARSIHYYLMEGRIPPIEDRQKGFIEESLHKSIAGVPTRSRVHEPVVSLEDRLGTFTEVEGTIDQEDARYESQRCLNCGIYCYDHDLELQRLAEGSSDNLEIQRK